MDNTVSIQILKYNQNQKENSELKYYKNTNCCS